jgi:hypothetical protein
VRNHGLAIGMALVMSLGSPVASGHVERHAGRRVVLLGEHRHALRPGVVVVDRRGGPGWGAVAAAAAAGVALGTLAARPRTVVVESPVVGTVVPTIPANCVVTPVPGGVLYNCNNVYYQPIYQGGMIMYQVVPFP